MALEKIINVDKNLSTSWTINTHTVAHTHAISEKWMIFMPNILKRAFKPFFAPKILHRCSEASLLRKQTL